MITRQPSNKSSSPAKVAANQSNAAKSTGPISTTSTRFNATKHGLLSQGITELDRPQGFHGLFAESICAGSPVAIEKGADTCRRLEEECVAQIAVLTVRIRKARVLEAEAFTAHLNPPETVSHAGEFAFDARALGWTEVSDPGLPAQVSPEALDQINRTILRYESAIENKLFRWLNQLERLQRRRQVETLPAPEALDVNVHHEHSDLASFGNLPDSVITK